MHKKITSIQASKYRLISDTQCQKIKEREVRGQSQQCNLSITSNTSSGSSIDKVQNNIIYNIKQWLVAE